MVFQTYLNKAAAKRAAMGVPKMRLGSTGVIRGLQLVVVLFSLFIAATIVGTAAHVYHVYKEQQSSYNPWWLPLWAGHFDTSGLKTTIGTASGVLFLNLIFMVLSFVPRFKAMSKVDTFAAGGISVPCILLSVAAIVVSTQINHRQNADTPQTWACKYKSLQGPKDTAQNSSNGDFGSLCSESKFAYWGMVAVLVLQTVLFASSVTQWVMGKSNESNMPNEKASEEYTPS